MLPRHTTLFDILDQFVPDDNDPLDGRLSRFAAVPLDRRPEARSSLIEATDWALPEGLAHGLALYPQCPAAWLFEDWERENHSDPEPGANCLKRLVAALDDPRGRESTAVRMMALARHAKHGRLHLPASSDFADLAPRYPNGLDKDELGLFESSGRVMWNAISQMDDRRAGLEWAEYFWRQGWHVSACEPWGSRAAYLPRDADSDPGPSEREESTGTESDPALTPPRLALGFATAVRDLGAKLDRLRDRCEIDLYEPTPDEVRLGLAARQLRLLRRSAEDFRLWTSEMGPLLARSMIDTRIVLAWLLKQDDSEPYRKFKDFGLGKRKLFKLQIEDFIDRDDFDGYKGLEEIHKRLEAEVNLEHLEEFQNIDLGGTFSGKSLRDMAIEANLKDLYVLNFQPYSTEVHGEWGSLIGSDLEPCGNPLHKHHWRASFGTGDLVIHPGWIRHLLTIAWESIGEVFEKYGVDVDEAFEACVNDLSAAMSPDAPNQWRAAEKH
jgi:hypothetical protein